MVKYDYSNLEEQTLGDLTYWIVEEGTGYVPKQRSYIIAHYTGLLEDGTMFDNSYQRGQPIQVPIGVGQVIQGWDEFFMHIPVGTKAVVRIPAEKAYGDRSPSANIPANSTLIFHVYLMECIFVMGFTTQEIEELNGLSSQINNKELLDKIRVNYKEMVS